MGTHYQSNEQPLWGNCFEISRPRGQQSLTRGTVTSKWLITSSRNSNLSKILCLSLLPVRMEIELTVTEKRWRNHFLHYKSMGKEKIRTQGQITAKLIMWFGLNSHSFELLCLSSLSASLTNIWSKVTEKSWRNHYFHCSRACISKVTSQILPEFKPVQDLMPVLFSCEFDEDWIHSNWEKMETSFSPI